MGAWAYRPTACSRWVSDHFMRLYLRLWDYGPKQEHIDLYIAENSVSCHDLYGPMDPESGQNKGYLWRKELRIEF